MTSSMSVARTWGTTPAERALPQPCDALIAAPDDVLHRAVSVAAPAPVVWRWLCQLRVAPYSYDWIDNLGRRSPRRLVDGLDRLAVGQDVMRIFTLAAFAPDEHLTVRMKPGTPAFALFGDVAVTYRVYGERSGCRLVVKLLVRYPAGLAGPVLRRLLPWGDLVMMRRQLLTLKALAEATAVASPEAAP
jgi:hypothetical protein